MSDVLSIDLADLGEEVLAFRGQMAAGELDFADIRQRSPLQWAVTVQKSTEGFRLTGTVETELELECVRCLEPVTEEVVRNFDLFFQDPSSLVYEAGDEIELDESDIETAFVRGTALSLGEVIQEQVLLALPMKPLCSSQCRGWCSLCGTNLNKGTCECIAPEFNPVFETLREFKKQLESTDP